MFPWSGSAEERMASEVEDELAVYRRRCEALHDEFRKKLRVRDEARAALSEAEERVAVVQTEGVARLGSINAAMSGGDEEKVKELEHGYKKNNRDLLRAQKARDAAARRLEAVEVDDEKAVADLKRAATKVLDEYAKRVWSRKQWLADFTETLNRNQETLIRDAAPLTGDYEPWQPPGEPTDEDREDREGRP